jgi:hypothetical protein
MPAMPSINVSETLQNRGGTHGEYHVQSNCSQNIADAMRSGLNWDNLPAYAKQALEMVAVKLGRILSGDWTYADHWHDLAGYPQLVEKELKSRHGGPVGR